MSARPTVFVVDDDASVRDGLTRLLAAGGYAVEAFGSAEAFLAACDGQRPGCLLLDVQMPGMGGLGLQSVLAERELRWPIIFLTAHGTVPTTVRALKGGAFDFLEKPAEGGALLARVREALRLDAERRRAAAARAAVLARCAALTAREREIVPFVAGSESSKAIARRLGISHRTVELHRARIMRKLGARTVVELATLARAGGLAQAPSSPGSPESS
jgi:FixJ family two-component response regulator